jgi:hypothetical protein
MTETSYRSQFTSPGTVASFDGPVAFVLAWFQVISKRFYKKQQMAWTPRGAHLLLQIRTCVLNGDWEATFREWYPGFRAAPQPMAA